MRMTQINATAIIFNQCSTLNSKKNIKTYFCLKL